MPQPLRRRIMLFGGPVALLQRPHLAMRIAVISAAWAEVEESLAWLLARMLVADIRVTMRIFDRLVSLKAQLDALDAAASEALSESLYKELSKSLIREIRARAAERNRIVHGMWSVANEYPDALILRRSLWAPPESRTPMIYVAEDFTETAQRIVALLEKIHDFTRRVSESATRGPPTPSRPPPQPRSD